MKMLNLVTKLFHNMAPNTTAWCESLDAFLREQGFKLEKPVSSTRARGILADIFQDSLRRRFANTLQWYGALRDAQTAHVNGIILERREDLVECIQPRPPNNGSPETDEAAPRADARPQGSQVKERPSSYLRERCPLCFGGRESCGEDMR